MGRAPSSLLWRPHHARVMRKKTTSVSPHCGSVVMNQTSIHEDVGSILSLAQWVKDPMLWLWCRLAAAAPTRPLVWEPPYDTGVTLKKLKKKRHPKHRSMDCPHSREAQPIEPGCSTEACGGAWRRPCRSGGHALIPAKHPPLRPAPHPPQPPASQEPLFRLSGSPATTCRCVTPW